MLPSDPTWQCPDLKLIRFSHREVYRAICELDGERFVEKLSLLCMGDVPAEQDGDDRQLNDMLEKVGELTVCSDCITFCFAPERLDEIKYAIIILSAGGGIMSRQPAPSESWVLPELSDHEVLDMGRKNKLAKEMLVANAYEANTLERYLDKCGYSFRKVNEAIRSNLMFWKIYLTCWLSLQTF